MIDIKSTDLSSISFEGGEIFHLVIDKKDIQNFEVEDFYTFLALLKESGPANENSLIITINGYDDDGELYIINEVREYIQFLDKSFPYWFYFINKEIPKEHSFLKIMLLCNITIHNVIPNATNTKQQIEFDIEELEKIINTHFHFLNELTDSYGLSIEENKRISEQVMHTIF